MTDGHDTSRPRLVGLALLLLLLACQAALLAHHVSGVPPGVIVGDEHEYVAKAAYLQCHGEFPRIPGDQYGSPFPVEFWGNTDWRPFGYPALLALISYPNVRAPRVRERVAIVQFLLVSLSLGTLFAIAVSRDGGVVWAATVAVILGVSPWPFSFAGQIGPETAVLFLSTVGTGVLGLWASKNDASGGLLLILGSGLLALSLLFRPESIVMAPILVMAAATLRTRATRARRCRTAGWLALGCVPIVAAITAQVAYRAHVAGRIEIFAPAKFFNEGAFAWLHTWLNTEKLAYDGIAYRLANAGISLEEIPPRAFRDDAERRRVSEAVGWLERTGHYTAEIDAAFAELAVKRCREAPLQSFVLPRLARTAQLWLNTESSPQLLSLLRSGPRWLSRATVGAVLLEKLLILGAAGLAAIGIIRTLRVDGKPAWNAVTAMFATFVIARTLLVGIGLGWMVARYMVPAWPAVLFCGCEGFRALARGRSGVPTTDELEAVPAQSVDEVG